VSSHFKKLKLCPFELICLNIGDTLHCCFPPTRTAASLRKYLFHWFTARSILQFHCSLACRRFQRARSRPYPPLDRRWKMKACKILCAFGICRRHLFKNFNSCDESPALQRCGGVFCSSTIVRCLRVDRKCCYCRTHAVSGCHHLSS